MVVVSQKSYATRLVSQTVALAKKNLLMGMRNWRSTVILLSVSFLFLVMAKLMATAIEYANREEFVGDRDPSPESISSLPECLDDMYITRNDCIDIAYTPAGNDKVESIVTGLRTNNPGRVIPESRVLGFDTPEEVDDWMRANPERVLSAVHFEILEDKVVQFGIQTNSTPRFFKNEFQHPNEFVRLPLQHAVQREVVREMIRAKDGDTAANELVFDVDVVSYPRPATESVQMEGIIVPFFILWACLFGFVMQMGELATEKETGLRSYMRTVGMLDSAFWLSWMAWHTVQNFIMAFSLLLSGLILQFEIFLGNDQGLLLVLFFFFANAMTGLGYLLVALIRKASTATTIGIAIVILGWMTMIFVSFGVPFHPEFKGTKVGGPLIIVFGMMPWALLAKGISDFGKAVIGRRDGLTASRAASYCRDFFDVDVKPDLCYPDVTVYQDCECMLPIADLIWILFLAFIGYSLVGIYLDNVLPQENGTRRSPWFFMDPAYWSPRFGSLFARLWRPALLRVRLEGASCHSEDDDVQAEFRRLKERLGRIQRGEEGDQSNTDAIELFGVRRIFRRGLLGLVGAPFEAVRGSWYSIRRGEVFCLLGPNGAGKSTTINCLTGQLPLSGGEAIIHGQQLHAPGGIDRIRAVMGVCPQFDVLWGLLTGLEHMRLYAGIKGVDQAALEGHISELLGRVQLTKAADLRVKGYSGGMKRRLSVAIALMGDPSVIFLDEPTTGMDPISKRHVWEIIEEAKPGRAIVLTTHSMEEADILGDRIAVMARGSMRCLGTSTHLKHRFGAGIHVVVVLGADSGDFERRLATIQDIFRKRVGVANYEASGTHVEFVVPKAERLSVVSLLEHLESNARSLGIKDVQVSMSSLEEVFLAIAKQAEVEAAQQLGAQVYCDFPLPDGKMLRIPVGADVFVDAAGARWKVQWAQGADGGITVANLAALPPQP